MALTFSITHDRGKIQDVKGALLAAVKRAGLPKITWHMFRHTFASRLTRNGVDIVTVKELLGHSNISTLRIPMMKPSAGRWRSWAPVTKRWQSSTGTRK